jgi:tRNA threonylcarbamoyladenosine biosynthesis protein TsaE
MKAARPKKASDAGGGIRVVVTRSEAETIRTAKELAGGFRGTEIVLLSGELGAGKTVFAKGLAAGLGVEDAGRVCSPSYTLINVYKGRVPVYHIDLYRLERGSEIRDLGWEDYLGEGVVIIEWAERLPFPVDGIRVAIEPGADDTRTITIRRP